MHQMLQLCQLQSVMVNLKWKYCGKHNYQPSLILRKKGVVTIILKLVVYHCFTHIILIWLVVDLPL